MASATIVAALMITAGSAPAHAEYRIQTGDVLEIAVAGVPELRQRVPVSVDGEISYPLIGQIKVAGMPLTEARDTLKTILPTRIYQQRTADGRTISVQIISEEVTVSIVEYRPIYLRGDVSKPGEQAFRPGMNVRQAISLAGGFDIMRFRMGNPFLEAADLRAEYDALWLEFAKGQARLSRLQAELEGRTEMPKSIGLEAPIPERIAERIAQIEAEQFQVRAADRSKEVASRLSAVAEKLLYTGAVKSQVVRGQGEAPSIVLYRKAQDGSSQQVPADESTELQPGDVIDVALPMAPLEAMKDPDGRKSP